MRIVAALGGNALARRGEPLDARTQQRNVAMAVRALAPLARAHQLVITHGNGPQIGRLALREQHATDLLPDALDVLGAETEGMIGYAIERELRSLPPPRVRVAAMLTMIEVDAHDPAFLGPDKPIGPVYTCEQARQLAEAHGWTVAADGHHWRRVVASPRPLGVLGLDVIELLLDAGVTVICAGGGGIPVLRNAAGALAGVEAVIDKDRASALIAAGLRADLLLLLTDVEGVYPEWPDPRQAPFAGVSAATLRTHAFAPGSMGPKVEAACEFVERSARPAVIGRLEDAVAMAAGERGTRVV